jgi:hypothetical protein
MAPSNQLLEWYLSSLTKEQIERYLRHPQERVDAVDADAYQAYLAANPSLLELINTPFLLKIFVDAFPALHGQQQQQRSSSQLTRNDLYGAFMDNWFATAEEKLIETFQSTSVRKLFKDFSRSLAYAMFKRETSAVIYHEVVDAEEINEFELDLLSDEEVARRKAQLAASAQWRKWFSQADAKVKLARKGCPLRSLGGTTFSFVHQSFLEYFVADALWQSLVAAAPNSKTVEMLGTRCLNKAPKMPVVVEFLVDRLRVSGTEDAAAKKV